MRRRINNILLVALILAESSLALLHGEEYRSRIPIPDDACEHVGLGIHDVVELKDKAWLANNGRVSTDKGHNWSGPKPFGQGARGNRLTRLTSGKIVLSSLERDPSIWISSDEGDSWTDISRNFPRMMGGPNCYGGIQELKSGRLMTVCSVDFNPKFPGHLYEDVQAQGNWNRKPYSVEGHQHLPEIYLSFVVYSDDQGKTWKMAEGYYGVPLALFGWFDLHGIVNGNNGHWSFGEVSLAETQSGRLLTFGRSEVGRIVYTSSVDNGASWNALLPSELPNSGSPPFLTKIPKTGDLLCVWNQVSHEEIRRGYRRGRLSTAISKDGGFSWENFKTLELSVGMEDTVRIAAEYPITMVRARQYVGDLPDQFSYFHYPKVAFAADRVILMYLRGAPINGIAEQKLDEQQNILRVYPLEWFYEQDETPRTR